MHISTHVMSLHTCRYRYIHTRTHTNTQAHTSLHTCRYRYIHTSTHVTTDMCMSLNTCRYTYILLARVGIRVLEVHAPLSMRGLLVRRAPRFAASARWCCCCSRCVCSAASCSLAHLWIISQAFTFHVDIT